MLKELTTRFYNSTIIITKKVPNDFRYVTTAFVCSAKGYILTCAHAIELNAELFAAIPTSDEEFQLETGRIYNMAPITIAQYDPINDVALLKIDQNVAFQCPPPSVVLGSEIGIPIGSSVGYIGFPFASRGLQTGKVSSGIISAKALNGANTRTLQIDSQVNDGNSGGPLIDVSTQKIIGIISGRYSPVGSFSGVAIGGVGGAMPLGQDSNISYATGISYGIELMKAEGIYE